MLIGILKTADMGFMSVSSIAKILMALLFLVEIGCILKD